MTLNSVSPSALTAGVAATLQLGGTNFTPATIVYLSGTVLSTSYFSLTRPGL